MPDDGIIPRVGGGGFVAVVGPSGAGKDTLIDLARRHFARNPKVAFPPRTITRPVDAGGEDHIAVDDETFDRQIAAGAFALYWHAHGLGYGISNSVDGIVSDGGVVVCNLSRSIVPALRIRYARRLIVSIAVNREALASRLMVRGRESAEQIAKRMERAAMEAPAGDDVLSIDNSGAPEAAAEILIREIEKRLLH